MQLAELEKLEQFSESAPLLDLINQEAYLLKSLYF
jgi:hypothetical protein